VICKTSHVNFLNDRGEPSELLNRQRVREELCSLTIQERAELGEHIAYLSARAVDECSAGGALDAAIRMGRDKVYVVIVGVDANLAERSVDALGLTIAACVYCEHPTGIGLILNQVGNDILQLW
jgi:hypothetical protein